jgi:hypothetical protein
MGSSQGVISAQKGGQLADLSDLLQTVSEICLRAMKAIHCTLHFFHIKQSSYLLTYHRCDKTFYALKLRQEGV